MRVALLLFVLVFSRTAFALNVFACEPEWAALAKEIGGDKLSVVSATTAMQDPHRIEARPSLIARVRSADLVVCSGSELEVGWLPLLLSQSGNAKIQPGSPGYLEASRLVARLEIPTVLDRSLGDVHPNGNPHVHLDPRNIRTIANGMTARLTEIDRANSAFYAARAADFVKRWDAAMDKWRQQAAALRGVPVIVYHKDMSYFLAWSGMREAGALEPKPGIPPSPAHLADLVNSMMREPAKVIVYSPYNNPQAAQFLSEKTKIPNVLLPYTVGGTGRAKDLFGLFDDTIERLVKAVK